MLAFDNRATVPMLKVGLRRAESTDSSFAYEVTESAMRCHVERTWGSWKDERQRESHDSSFDPATHGVVLVDEVPSGIVAIKEESIHLQLEKLYLLPGVRNRGVGAELLRMLFERSRETKKPVRLRLLKPNTSAQRFYERHGFTIASVTAERVFMERSCA